MELVVRQDIRLEWPDDDEAPQISDTIWELAENCWVKDPKHRLTVSAMCNTLLHLLDTTTISQPIATISPLHPIVMAQLLPLWHAPAQASPPRPLTLL